MASSSIQPWQAPSFPLGVQQKTKKLIAASVTVIGTGGANTVLLYIAETPPRRRASRNGIDESLAGLGSFTRKDDVQPLRCIKGVWDRMTDFRCLSNYPHRVR
jgi:hypothetical protein